MPKASRLCEKSNEVSSPRKRGGNDKTGGIGFYTVSIPWAKVAIHCGAK